MKFDQILMVVIRNPKVQALLKSDPDFMADFGSLTPAEMETAAKDAMRLAMQEEQEKGRLFVEALESVVEDLRNHQ